MLKGLFLIEYLKVQLSFMSLSKLSTNIVNPFEFKRILNDKGSDSLQIYVYLVKRKTACGHTTIL